MPQRIHDWRKNRQRNGVKGRTKNKNPARGCDSGPCPRLHPGPAQTQAPGAHGPPPQPRPGPAPPWPRPTLAGAALAAVDDGQHHGLHVAARTVQVQEPHGALGVQAVATAVALAQQVRLLARSVAELRRARRSLPKPPSFPLLAFCPQRTGAEGGPEPMLLAQQGSRLGRTCHHQVPALQEAHLLHCSPHLSEHQTV